MTDVKSTMNADREDRVSGEETNHSSRWIVLTCLVALTLAGIYFYTNTTDNTAINESNETLKSEDSSTDIPKTSTPNIPYVSPSFDQKQAAISDDVEHGLPNVTSPVINKEEAAIKMQDALIDLSDSLLLLESFYTPNLIERIAAIVDSSSKGIVIHRMLPLKPLKEKFPIAEKERILIMDPTGYHRFDPYVEALVSLEVSELRALFHEYRSYLEQAYAALGYQQEELDNAIIKSLDQIISAPTIKTAIAIVEHEAVYRFLDEDLEALPELHKQLLRMGPDNVEKIQSFATNLRAALIEEEMQR
ncbi:MAG: DUF3014 domain-containing protein [Halieaceae bacterium]|nr:DUF3014 domain-containing protein [Halieaceae bacterium]